MSQESSGKPEHGALFESFAAGYDEALMQGLSATGESQEYFIEGRMRFLASCLRSLSFVPQVALDFGCGTGTSTPYFFEHLGVGSLIGLDVSAESLRTAAERHGSLPVRFLEFTAYEPCGEADLVYCNGVFHHIPRAGRLAAVEWIRKALRPGGVFAFWENNPWNPGTRWVMSRIPFDRDSVPVSVFEAGRLLRGAGLEVIRADFLFIFPRSLSGLRPLERCVRKLPFGGQYQVLCRRPEA